MLSQLSVFRWKGLQKQNAFQRTDTTIAAALVGAASLWYMIQGLSRFIFPCGPRFPFTRAVAASVPFTFLLRRESLFDHAFRPKSGGGFRCLFRWIEVRFLQRGELCGFSAPRFV